MSDAPPKAPSHPQRSKRTHVFNFTLGTHYREGRLLTIEVDTRGKRAVMRVINSCNNTNLRISPVAYEMVATMNLARVWLPRMVDVLLRNPTEEHNRTLAG